MRQSGRWQLTDVQRFGVVAAVVTSLFLAAMSLGMGSVILLLVAFVLIVVVGLGIFLLGIRFNGRAPLHGEAHVVMVSAPPANQIVGRCDLRLVVDLPGRSPADVKMRDPSVPVIRWPRVGQILPVDVDSRRRQLRIRWDLIDTYQPKTGAHAEQIAEEAAAVAVPFFTDYADRAIDAEYSPTPPSTLGDIEAPLSPTLEEEFTTAHDRTTDFDNPTVHRGTDQPPAPAPPGSFGPPHPADIADAEVIAETDPIGIDQAEAAGFELPARGVIPQPRPAGNTVEPRPPKARNAADANADPSNAAMGMMLVVSNLDRSVRFYRDLVGLEVVDNSASSAVLAYGGFRLLLRQLADMSPVDRRVAHPHIAVPDVEVAYQDLRAKGVPFVHKPRITNRTDKLDLWAATFRDPDGHDVALTQWRDRDDEPGR